MTPSCPHHETQTWLCPGSLPRWSHPLRTALVASSPVPSADPTPSGTSPHPSRKLPPSASPMVGFLSCSPSADPTTFQDFHTTSAPQALPSPHLVHTTQFLRGREGQLIRLNTFQVCVPVRRYNIQMHNEKTFQSIVIQQKGTRIQLQCVSHVHSRL